jgi:hypothetical protein
MKVYTNITIKITERNSFDNDAGETIEYGSAYIKGEDGSVLKLSTGKKDFSEYEGQEGLAVLNVREDGKHLKLSLIEFRPEATITF